MTNSLVPESEVISRQAVEDYVHRIAPMGARVLINGIWFFT
jgi:hypothetical protein